MGSGESLQTAVLSSDSLARLGGDEFIVLLPSVGGEEAETIALRICRSLDTSWTLGSGNISASVSVGVALYPDAGSTPDELLRSADGALYKAKSAGRACVRIYDGYA